MPNPSVIDVGAFMETRRLGIGHLRVFLFCAMVALLDGADSQSIGVAAPALAAAIGVKMPAFAPIFSAGQLGAMIGALGSGMIADRMGRKRLLIINTVLFGLFTLATPFAHSFEVLFLLRLAAGLGLGGATPCFLALMSDYAPRTSRATLVSLLWAAFPIGATLGGFLSAYLVSTFGWRTIFFVGGVTPLAVALALTLGLTESPQFLTAGGAPPDTIRRILQRFTGEPLADDTLFTTPAQTRSRPTVGGLFADGRRLFTPLLWGVFATAFSALTVFVLWTPALLKEQGLAVAQTAVIVSMFNLGSMLGQGSAGRLVDRFGPLWVLAPGLILGAAFYALVGQAHLSAGAHLAFAFTSGIGLGLGSSGAIALCALAYPSRMRSTAIGWGMGLGRGGQVVGPLIAGAVLGLGFHPDEVILVMAAVPVMGALLVVPLVRAWRTATPAD